MLGSFIKNTIYITVSETLITAKDVVRNKTFYLEPTVAFENKGGKQKVLTVGSNAINFKNKENVSVVNAFNHPRTIIGDFEAGVMAIKYCIGQVMYKKAFIRPAVIIHPLEKLEGGLTVIEIRALCEMVQAAGAWKVMVWIGNELTEAQVAKKDFTNANGLLLATC